MYRDKLPQMIAKRRTKMDRHIIDIGHDNDGLRHAFAFSVGGAGPSKSKWRLAFEMQYCLVYPCAVAVGAEERSGRSQHPEATCHRTVLLVIRRNYEGYNMWLPII